jgi:hypothetical protein
MGLFPVLANDNPLAGQWRRGGDDGGWRWRVNRTEDRDDLLTREGVSHPSYLSEKRAAFLSENSATKEHLAPALSNWAWKSQSWRHCLSLTPSEEMGAVLVPAFPYHAWCCTHILPLPQQRTLPAASYSPPRGPVQARHLFPLPILILPAQ